MCSRPADRGRSNPGIRRAASRDRGTPTIAALVRPIPSAGLEAWHSRASGERRLYDPSRVTSSTVIKRGSGPPKCCLNGPSDQDSRTSWGQHGASLQSRRRATSTRVQGSEPSLSQGLEVAPREYSRRKGRSYGSDTKCAGPKRKETVDAKLCTMSRQDLTRTTTRSMRMVHDDDDEGTLLTTMDLQDFIDDAERLLACSGRHYPRP